MGRCRGAASTWVQCLVAHVPQFSSSLQGLPDKKSLIDSLSWWHKFLVDDLLIIKKNENRFEFEFAHSRFLGRGDFALCHS